MIDVSELLHKYVTDSRDKELEVRLYVDPRQRLNVQNVVENNDVEIRNTFDKIITSLLNDMTAVTITKTIEFIKEYPDRSKKRLQILMPDKIRTYMTKKELYTKNENSPYGSYKISVSEEKIIPEDKMLMKDFSKIRIKLRLTIFTSTFPEWRYDITFVKLLHKLENLQKQKNVMFPNRIQPSTFLQKAPYNYVDHIEIEAEFIGDATKLIDPIIISKIVNQIYTIINPSIESTAAYQEYLSMLAKIIIGPKYRPNNLSFKVISNSVKELSKAVYVEKIWPIIENWWLTDKADGQRALILASQTEIVIISDYLYIVKCKGTSSKRKSASKEEFSSKANDDEEEKLDYSQSGGVLEWGEKLDYDLTCYNFQGGERANSAIFANDPYILAHKELTIVDAELIYNNPLPTKIDGTMLEILPQRKPILFTFDVIMIEGKSIAHNTFGERFKNLNKATSLINKWCDQCLAELKPFVRLTKKNYHENISLFYNRPHKSYDIDGLIFYPNAPSESNIMHNKNNPYKQINTTYQNTEVWKWKPIPSIDFLMHIVPQSMLGKFPYVSKDKHKLYFLFSGINNAVFNRMNITPVRNYASLFGNDMLKKQYHPIQFTPSSNPLAYLYWHPDNIKLKTIGGVENTTELSHFEENTQITDHSSRNEKTDISEKHTYNEIYGFSSLDSSRYIGKSEKHDELDGKIGEFTLIIDKTTEKETWKLIKIRVDRTQEAERGKDFGNDFTMTAERIWDNFHNPLNLKDLILKPKEFVKEEYFKETDSLIHKPQRSFNSFVKNELLYDYARQSWITDMGGGKGQDLFRYASKYIHNVLFLDNDSEAISELLIRKRTFLTGIQEGAHKKIRDDYRKMGIYVMEMDLNKRYDTNLTRIKTTIPLPKEGVPLVICSLAFHYFMSTTRQLDNILLFIDGIIATTGHVLITTFDGESVFNLMKKYRGHYKIVVDGRLKYSIKANYPISSQLSDIGQTIDVLLPFSAGTHYIETLVNIQFLIKKFKRSGFQLVKHGSYSEFLLKFKSKNTRVFDMLTDDDKEYVSLYQYLIVKKMPKKTRVDH